MASMKLYNALADKLRRHVFMAYGEAPDQYVAGLETAIKAVAQVLEEDNPRFDRERFLSACGLVSSEARWGGNTNSNGR